MLDKLNVLIENAPLGALKNQMLEMCTNYRLYNDGYPDIMELENGQLRFEEIKAQGDSLRRNQLMQLQSLRGIDVGIVKLVNGEVVEKWQSLINPQRHIPAMITSLTDITNGMVADAPLFADIANELENFTENCIFVAHNVNFNYGFIREEFACINRTYRRPKLCNVQQMRKHIKGLPNYSLANLTRHFNIDMDCHHRAVAASELLNLVNESRQTEP